MSKPNYWLDLFTGKTWNEFQKAGGKVSGFRESRWTTLQKIKPGDYLLCYLTGVSRFIGILEVTSKPYKGKENIWSDEDFPCRVKVKPTVILTPETAVPIAHLKSCLSIFKNLKNPNAWTGSVRGSPAKWEKKDGDAILKTLNEAKENPITRAFDPKKFARRPKAIKARIGPVVIPEKNESLDAKEPASHTEIQWLLLKLGGDLGFNVWVAQNDKNKEWKGNKFGDLNGCLKEMPLPFEDATNKTIRLIDVLWLKGKTIITAFEIESTTSIYSGLLRMSDLISMQPNLKIPLFIVAPDERRDKVVDEINRPTFMGLEPPMSQICRYISFSILKKKLKEAQGFVQYLKPEFLDEISESCEEDL